MGPNVDRSKAVRPDPKNHERAAASTWESVLGGSGWRGRSIRRGRSSTWTFGAGSGLFVVLRMVSSWRVAAPEPLARAGGFVFCGYPPTSTYTNFTTFGS